MRSELAETSLILWPSFCKNHKVSISTLSFLSVPNPLRQWIIIIIMSILWEQARNVHYEIDRTHTSRWQTRMLLVGCPRPISAIFENCACLWLSPQAKGRLLPVVIRVVIQSCRRLQLKQKWSSTLLYTKVNSSGLQISNTFLSWIRKRRANWKTLGNNVWFYLFVCECACLPRCVV